MSEGEFIYASPSLCKGGIFQPDNVWLFDQRLLRYLHTQSQRPVERKCKVRPWRHDTPSLTGQYAAHAALLNDKARREEPVSPEDREKWLRGEYD